MFQIGRKLSLVTIIKDRYLWLYSHVVRNKNVQPVVDLEGWGGRGRLKKEPSDYVIILSQPRQDFLTKPRKGYAGCPTIRS